MGICIAYRFYSGGMARFLRRFVLLLFLCVPVSALAQRAEDSVRFCSAENWKTVAEQDGIRIRSYRTGRDAGVFLFDAPQAIYVMEVDTARCRLGLVQQARRRTVRRLVHAQRALAGVNGGFFVVHPEPKRAAVANDFLKIGGRIVSPVPTPGWGSGAVGIARGVALGFTQWNRALEADTVQGWRAAFPDVMAAGPMLLLRGGSLHPWTEVDKPNLTDAQRRSIYAPRTAIGVRADGTIVLLVVDGRRAHAFGASMAELSLMGRWLGLTDMLNLDGGGSSTMVWGRTLINFPSDGFGIVRLERPVANAVVVLPR